MVFLQTSASFYSTLSTNQCFYATHNQSYPSVSEERAACWVGFGEHVDDALIHKLLDDDTKKILYRSAVGPSDSAHPHKRLVPDEGRAPRPPNPLSLSGLGKIRVNLTEVWHISHFWVSYGRCTMPGSPMGRSEGLARRWAG